MAVDFAILCSLVRPGRPHYPVLIHRAAALLRAVFRPHLAMTPLRFANPSPPSGWIEDFHLQAVVHTRHTIKKRAARRPPFGHIDDAANYSTPTRPPPVPQTQMQTNRNSQTTSTKCQYQAANSKPRCWVGVKWPRKERTRQTARNNVPMMTWKP